MGDGWRHKLDEPPPEVEGARIFVKSIEVYRWSAVRGWQRGDGLSYVDQPLPVGCEWMPVPDDEPATQDPADGR